MSDLADDTKLWRYMGFSKFVWMLMKKQLWLSRIDLLGDDFEFTPSGAQMNTIMTSGSLALSSEQKQERLKALIKQHGERTYVNCWMASEHESIAMWDRCCGSHEGVALQTTLRKLRSAAPLGQIRPVTYDEPLHGAPAPTIIELATRKRPMFSHEKEVRIVHFWERPYPNGQPFAGYGLEWNIETALDYIWVKGDFAFMESVMGVVEHFAPALKDAIPWSATTFSPPL